MVVASCQGWRLAVELAIPARLDGDRLGLFNVVEGVVNHHLLQIHQVRPGAANPLVWDIGFLILGALLIAGGLAMQKQEHPTSY